MTSKIKLIFLLTFIKAGPFEDWKIITAQRKIEQQLKEVCTKKNPIKDLVSMNENTKINH